MSRTTLSVNLNKVALLRNSRDIGVPNLVEAARVVIDNGADGLTRANLLDALSKIRKFDAGGMIGASDVGGRRFGPCYMVMQIKDQKWVRVFPKKPGTFDCTAENLLSVKVDQPTA